MNLASQQLPRSRASYFLPPGRQSILSPEGIPLTMQIGMVGLDGIVLASDTQATHTPKRLADGMTGRAVRYHTNCSKIVTSGEIAVSYARDMKSGENVASTILSSFISDDPQEAIERIAASIPVDNRYDVQGLIANPPYQLFRFQIATIDGIWTATCNPSPGVDFAGDMTNAAMYWATRYYDELFTIEQLLPLAAYFITCSHHLNTAGVGGLEIVVCDSSGINSLSRERVLELKRQTKNTDRQVQQLLFGQGAPLS